jgi:hypothetical protein
MVVQDIFARGLSPGKLVFGIILGLIGIGFFLAAFVWNYTLSISGLRLPQWAMYLVTGVMLITGIATAKDGFFTWQCAICGTDLKYAEAAYPEDFESRVKDVFNTINPQELKTVPMSHGYQKQNKKGGTLLLQVDYCDKCRFLGQGLLTLLKYNRDGAKEFIGRPKVISGEQINRFLPYVSERSRIEPLLFEG